MQLSKSHLASGVRSHNVASCASSVRTAFASLHRCSCTTVSRPRTNIPCGVLQSVCASVCIYVCIYVYIYMYVNMSVFSVSSSLPRADSCCVKAANRASHVPALLGLCAHPLNAHPLQDQSTMMKDMQDFKIRHRTAGFG